MTTIAIIGANGYTGRFLTEHFSKAFKVIAVHRSAFPVIKQLPEVSYISMYDGIYYEADVIINASFSSAPDVYRNLEENAAVAAYMKQHSHASTKIIHLSSLAVFGFMLEKEARTEPVRNRFDYLYVESKIHMENMLRQTFAHNQLQILRLGNIWGEANHSWTVPLLDALTFGIACRWKHPAYSNITYIRNLVAYIDHVVHHERSMPFHHVAELSHVKWEYFIDTLADELNVEELSITSPPPYSKNLAQEFDITMLNRPYGMLKKFKNGRFLQSRINHFLNGVRLPLMIRKLVSGGSIGSNRQSVDPAFYWTMCCENKFEPVMLEGFYAPYDENEALTNTIQWMTRAGYLTGAMR